MQFTDAGIQNLVSRGILDANEGYFFERQLEHILTQSFDVLYADLPARGLFPVDNSAGDGVTQITHRSYDHRGEAVIGAESVTQIPRADASGKEFKNPIESILTGFGYSIDEIRAAQRVVGTPLEQRRAMAARRKNEEKVNEVALFGNATYNLPGFLSNTEIPSGTATTGNWLTGATPLQIYNDIMGPLESIFATSKMVERANKILLPVAQYNYIQRTKFSSTGGTDTTIMQYILRNSPWIKSEDQIQPINELDGAGAGSTDRMVIYTVDPMKLRLHIPHEQEFLPVQQKNFEFIIPARSRISGVHVYYPLSAQFVDGI